MTAGLSEISDFDQVFKTLISDLWMNCKSQNGILVYSYVDLKDFGSLTLSQNVVKN